MTTSSLDFLSFSLPLEVRDRYRCLYRLDIALPTVRLLETKSLIILTYITWVSFTSGMMEQTCSICASYNHMRGQTLCAKKKSVPPPPQAERENPGSVRKNLLLHSGIREKPSEETQNNSQKKLGYKRV